MRRTGGSSFSVGNVTTFGLYCEEEEDLTQTALGPLRTWELIPFSALSAGEG